MSHFVQTEALAVVQHAVHREELSTPFRLLWGDTGVNATNRLCGTLGPPWKMPVSSIAIFSILIAKMTRDELMCERVCNVWFWLKERYLLGICSKPNPLRLTPT